MTSTDPRFTVLLPTHNRADVLPYAIASVLVQSEPDFELLIVADGCTDATREVVAAFPDPRIRLFDLPKAPGFGYADRNVALRQARGRLVAFAAHDDLLLPDHLALMGELLERHNVAWGYSRPLWVSTDGAIVPVALNLHLADELHTFMEQRNDLPASCIVHTRSALEQAGYWPEDVPARGDWVLWRRMLRATDCRLAYQRQPTMLHFTADWRRSRAYEGAGLRTMFDWTEQPWWPAILRHRPIGEPEQATVWRAMHQGGGAWLQAFRDAADTVIDRIAWMTACGMWAAMEAAVAAKLKAETEAEACRAELAALRQAVAERFSTEPDRR